MYLTPQEIEKMRKFSYTRIQNFCKGQDAYKEEEGLAISEKQWKKLCEYIDFSGYSQKDISIILAYIQSPESWENILKNFSDTKSLSSYRRYFCELVENNILVYSLEILNIWPKELFYKRKSKTINTLCSQLAKSKLVKRKAS